MKATPPQPPSPRTTETAGTDEEICLIGVTRLADFIDFVQTRAVGGRDRDRGELADLWRAAAVVYAERQATQAGVADKPVVHPLPSAIQSHVDKLVVLPNFQKTFDAVPVAFGMVELDKLVVSQQHITRSSVDKMLATLPQTLTDDELAALCLPLTADSAGFRLAHSTDSKYTFVSDTHDGRFLGAQVLAPDAVQGLNAGGHAQAVLALSLGFTTNVLNVVRYGSRMVLNNGYHRAIALRERGVTHAPCLIQVCGHWEDVGLAGSGEMYENGPVYFSSARPPLLGDFADPGLTHTVRTRRIRKEIRVSFEISTAQLET